MLTLFYLMLFTSTSLVVSSASWFMIWLALEINMVAFIPLLQEKKIISDSAMKYFMVQSLSSATLLMGIILNMHSFYYHSEKIMVMALLMKIGMAPFHFWLPAVMKSTRWMINLILLTWQKIAPLFALLNLPTMNMTIFIILSAMIGAVGGYNQTNLSKLIAYSSIGHTAWLITALMINENLLIMYFTIYIIITIAIITFLMKYSVTYVSQMMNMNNSVTTYLMMMCLLSLGGLPPFLGFFPKWQVLSHMALNAMFTLSLLMVISSLITLFYYMRITYFAFMMTPPLSKFTHFLKADATLLLAMITLSGLPLMMIFFYK